MAKVPNIGGPSHNRVNRPRRSVSPLHPDRFQQALQAHQQQRVEAARALYQQLLEENPHHSGGWINLGSLHRQAGELEAALHCYQRALSLGDAPIELHFNLGNLYLQQGQADRALHHYQQLPAESRTRLQQSRALTQLGQLQQASETLQQLLTTEPTHPAALLELGHLHRNLHRLEAAQQSYQQLIEHHPNHWKGHYALARLLWERDPATAEIHLRAALNHAPDAAAVLLPLAQSLMAEGRYPPAQRLLERLLREQPDHATAQLELARVLSRQGGYTAAQPLLNALAQQENITLLSQLAELVLDLNDWQQALHLLRKVVQLAPDRPEVYLNLATACATTWQLDEALAVMQQALTLGRDPTELQSLIGSIHIKRGDVEAALAAYQQESAPLAQRCARLNFARLYSDQLTARDNWEHHRHCAAQLEATIPPQTHWSNPPDPHRPLRLGYVSADLHLQHPVDIYLQPVFEHHDRSSFQVTIYYTGTGYDSRTHRAKGLADRWVEVKGWADERLAQQIVQDQIDLLIDLSGHTAHNRLTLFARHPAPLQLTLVAYPHSTGLRCIDYLVGDGVLIPPSMQHLYSEQLLRLNHCIFNYPPDLHPLPRPRPHRDSIVFGSFNNVPKLTPTTIRLWAEVLQAVPTSTLLLKAPSFQDNGCCDRYRQLFAEQGIEPHRIEFRGPSGIDQMMAEYADLDIALDPTPFNGGTTTQQALLAGTPVVTLAGESFNQRMGASILSHLNHPEWIATHPAEYVAIAAGLAADRPRLRQMQAQLPQQMRHSSLCDNRGYTRDLERHYRQIWQQWCAEQSPSPARWSLPSEEKCYPLPLDGTVSRKND